MSTAAAGLDAERAALLENVTAVREGRSNDPIGAYHAYAAFLIAHPSSGDKATLFALLREGTDAHKDDKNLYVDDRFADLWLWYAARVNKPNAVYTFCIRRKIGTERSKLYLEYAAYLVKSGDRTKAEAVYQAGIARKAKPTDALKDAYVKFLAADGRTLPPELESKPHRPPTAPSPALGASSSTTASTSASAIPDTFVPPPPTAPASERAAWKRLSYMRQHVRTGGAPPPGRKREVLMLNLPSIFTAEGKEYCFEEARARSLGLLDKHWPALEPWEYLFPSERQAPKKVKAKREGGTVKFAEVVVAHEAAPPLPQDDSFASTASPPGTPETDVHASRTTVLRRMGHMGTGFGMPAPEPTMTINTKESLDDVYGMMNSPEKTLRSGMLPGSKYAPVVRIEAGAAPKRGNPLFRSTSSENAFRPFGDENAGNAASAPAFQPFVDEKPELNAVAPGPLRRPPAPPFKPFVDDDEEDVDIPPAPAPAPLQPFVDDDPVSPPRARTPANIQPFVDEDKVAEAPLPAQTPKIKPFTPFRDKTSSESLAESSVQTPAFRPFVDGDPSPAISGNEVKTPFSSSRDKTARRPLGAVTPAPATPAPPTPDDEDNDMDGVLPPPAPMNDTEWEEEEKRPELRPTTTPGNSTGEYSGTFRSVTRTSSSGDGSGVFSKPSVFVPRARTTSQGAGAGSAAGAEDRTRSASVGSNGGATAGPSIFRAAGGSVFKPKSSAAPFRPARAGRQATKTPPPPSISPEITQPPAHILAPASAPAPAPGSIFSTRQPLRSVASAPPISLSPTPPSEPAEDEEPIPIGAVAETEDASPLYAHSSTPPLLHPDNAAAFVPFTDDELHTPIEEYLEDDIPSYRQHIGRTGAVNLMTPIAERTIEYTTTTARSIAGTPSRNTAARESQQYALYMANKREELREEEEEEEEEPISVAQKLWPTSNPVVEPSPPDMGAPDEAAGLDVPNPCHPFEREILEYALQGLGSTLGFHDLGAESGRHLDNLQKFAKRNEPDSRFKLRIRDRGFVVSRKLGEGGFGAVFAARPLGQVSGDASDSDDDEEEEPDSLALKVVRSPNRWEFHMIRQIQDAVPIDMQRSFISAHDLFLFRDESFLVLELCTQGTLLDVVNRASALQLSRPGQPVDEVVVMFFMIELLKAAEAIHAAGIIHGDLKIDNCLVRLDTVPGGPDAWVAQYVPDGSGGWAHKRIALIDFGRAVDTRMFVPEQTFIGDWPTDDRDCPEMREGRPWTYQTDYFGIAGIAYCLLFGKYIDATAITQQGDRLKLASGIKRYWQVDIWVSLFDMFLNSTAVRGDGSLPLCEEIGALRAEMQAWLEKNCSRYGQTNLKGALKRLERGIL